MDKEYNQRPEESLDDWKYRLILGKANKEVKLKWQEIADLLCLTCSGEYLRKLAYGVLEYDIYLQTQNDTSIAADRSQMQLDELEEKEFEMCKEKMRMQDQKRELNKLLREWARAEHVEDMVREAVKEASALNPIELRKSANVALIEENAAEGVLLLSDWHIGMRTANVSNTYNDAVFNSRLETLLNKTLEHCRRHEIKKLHVFCLGDIVNGLIHVTTRINNTENVIKQTMKAAEALSHFLNTLAEELDIEVYFSRGNHERVSPNPKESIAGESFFDILPWYLKARLEGIECIKIHENELDEEIIVADVMGNTCFAVHGHKDKPGTAVQKLSAMLRVFPDYVFMGHFHSSCEREIGGAEVIVNGSLCGTDDYAMSLRLTGKPAQKFMVFNSNGRECTYNIRLDGDLHDEDKRAEHYAYAG